MNLLSFRLVNRLASSQIKGHKSASKLGLMADQLVQEWLHLGYSPRVDFATSSKNRFVSASEKKNRSVGTLAAVFTKSKVNVIYFQLSVKDRS